MRSFCRKRLGLCDPTGGRESGEDVFSGLGEGGGPGGAGAAGDLLLDVLEGEGPVEFGPKFSRVDPGSLGGRGGVGFGFAAAGGKAKEQENREMGQRVMPGMGVERHETQVRRCLPGFPARRGGG